MNLNGREKYEAAARELALRRAAPNLLTALRLIHYITLAESDEKGALHPVDVGQVLRICRRALKDTEDL